MNRALAIVSASLAALAVQPIVMFLWFALPRVLMGQAIPWLELGPILLLPVLFAIPFVILLGIPLSLFLHRFGKLRWWPLALAGAIAGSLLVGWDTPGGEPAFSYSGNWYGSHVQFVVAGQPTLYGWLNYFQSIVAFAAHGFFGATAYYLVWAKTMRAKNPSKSRPRRGAG